MPREVDIAVERLRYQWEDSAADMERAESYEHNLPHPMFRDGLRAAGAGHVADLFEAIHDHGLRDPLYVTERPREPGTFGVMAGNLRLAIARALGMPTVRCRVFGGSDSD